MDMVLGRAYGFLYFFLMLFLGNNFSVTHGGLGGFVDIFVRVRLLHIVFCAVELVQFSSHLLLRRKS